MRDFTLIQMSPPGISSGKVFLLSQMEYCINQTKMLKSQDLLNQFKTHNERWGGPDVVINTFLISASMVKGSHTTWILVHPVFIYDTSAFSADGVVTGTRVQVYIKGSTDKKKHLVPMTHTCWSQRYKAKCSWSHPWLYN